MIKKTDKTSLGKTLLNGWWACNMEQPPWKIAWQVPQNIKGRIIVGPSNSTPRCLTERNENIVHTKLMRECG